MPISQNGGTFEPVVVPQEDLSYFELNAGTSAVNGEVKTNDEGSCFAVSTENGNYYVLGQATWITYWLGRVTSLLSTRPLSERANANIGVRA